MVVLNMVRPPVEPTETYGSSEIRIEVGFVCCRSSRSCRGSPTRGRTPVLSPDTSVIKSSGSL